MDEHKQRDQAPSYTLGELAGALEHFGVHVSPDTLRPVLKTLGLQPDELGVDRDSGRGRVGYYGPVALWVVATAYHVVHSPRGKLRFLGELMKQYRSEAASVCDRWDSRHFFGNEDVCHDIELAARIRFVCDLKLGMDLRTLWSVARSEHRYECGLDDPVILTPMTLYNQEVLRASGVPTETISRLELDGSISDEPVGRQHIGNGGPLDEWEIVKAALRSIRNVVTGSTEGGDARS